MDGSVLPGHDMVSVEQLRSTVGSIVDPEIPVLTIEDLGILRSVESSDSAVIVTITPTYSGCPAMRQIEDDIATVLRREGVEEFSIETVQSPAWSSDWISQAGREKLAGFGIAPPTALDEITCPRCGAGQPELRSRFGSTACKALMVCSSCGEPFDHFKRF